MPNEQTELQKLFQRPDETFNLPSDQTETVTTPDEEVIPEDIKNRHVRRLEAKLQSEREANIAMAARIEALSEVSKFRQESGADEIETKLARIYGTDTPEKAEATRLLQEAIKGMGERAKAEAIEAFRAEQAQAQREVEEETSTLDSYVEQIEDQYGVDLTSTREARAKQAQYFELLEKLSPKKDGVVVDYADPFEVWDIFASRQAPDRSKELAARGMQRSRSGSENSPMQDPVVKKLMEEGLLQGF